MRREPTLQRILLLAAVAALTLAAAPAAVAKEITKAEVCGTGGCVSVDDEAGRMALMNTGAAIDTAAGGAVLRRARGGESRRRARRVGLRRRARARPLPAAGLIGAAPPPDPKPAAQPVNDGSLLWPEGILVALALAAGAFVLVRMLRRPGGLRPASG